MPRVFTLFSIFAHERRNRSREILVVCSGVVSRCVDYPHNQRQAAPNLSP